MNAFWGRVSSLVQGYGRLSPIAPDRRRLRQKTQNRRLLQSWIPGFWKHCRLVSLTTPISSKDEIAGVAGMRVFPSLPGKQTAQFYNLEPRTSSMFSPSRRSSKVRLLEQSPAGSLNKKVQARRFVVDARSPSGDHSPERLVSGPPCIPRSSGGMALRSRFDHSVHGMRTRSKAFSELTF
jgi:hypothetical protein